MYGEKEHITRIDNVKLKTGQENVIARGCRYEEDAWGHGSFRDLIR